ncbi:hypothetical protein CGRA01v4_06030 [Colletotrichum graminicola]|uniref:DUF967 domain-containing protein n=1 Tax=Colletotrichum graminicola (strain M1.001 / M2 / FGSC 10212) TaxID=645133 RepID=E3QYX0_COLGM|nr:uncharacterized protein GLRG_11202 [Colletotrichum graminicola M1.001]EFQ36058.1 hypothetical protein GLRG_11202 [Colletotrichum graminicola M1.001]WDK14749.1 hypothetical protein CGRA01v4_06030 [Colletotrichum graminicola]
MSQKVWTRRNPVGFGLEKSLEAVRSPGAAPVHIPSPPRDVEVLKEDGDSFTLSSFTYEDAFELGHLLHARLLPFALSNGKPTLVSIALANSQQIIFQTSVGPGTLPDNEIWVQRKRNSVLRWGCSTWLLHNKMGGDEKLFASKSGMSREQASKYAIHGGGVPIRVQGVEGVVAVVVVSGLKQDEDHGVIVDVIKSNWQCCA